MVTGQSQSDTEWSGDHFKVVALALAVAFGMGWIAHALFTPQPVSRAEAGSLAVIPRENMISGDWYFGEYMCLDDCSGHDAGFRWAHSRDVRRPGQCEGSGSNSFLEGCMVYLEIIGRVRMPE